MRVLALFLVACSTSSSGGGTPPSPDAGAVTGTCTGDPAKCLHGTVVTRGFNTPYADAKVQLYTLFPYGSAKPVGESASTKDGGFAFDGLDPSGKYYLQALAKWTSPAGTFAVASIVGPLSVPATDPLELHVRPVFLEALEQRPAGGQLTLSWASAHVYDPDTAKDIVDANVVLKANGQSYPMPMGANLSGQQSYFVDLSTQSVAPAAQLEVDVQHAAFASGATFTLVAAPPDFDPVVTAPAEGSQVSVGQALPVTWKSEPRAAYALVQFFRKAGGGKFVARYTSDAPRGAEVTSETVPAAAIDSAGDFLLNVQLARPSCPVTADGCVYNTSTAAVDLTAK
jgi:hypothetical protein